jgi:hypothetical protein
MAGYFDYRPPRDALTSVLNGIPKYEGELETQMKRERKEKRRAEKKKRVEMRARERELAGVPANDATPTASSSTTQLPPKQSKSSSFWSSSGRPSIHIATNQRSMSVTPTPPTSPDPEIFTPVSTPEPSISSSTSRTSSKRPRTPSDDEMDDEGPMFFSAPPRQRKKRSAAKKGWKGWVEGSPEPSDKLINLDSAPVLHERRTRSGKNFDAIGIGKASWV